MRPILFGSNLMQIYGTLWGISLVGWCMKFGLVSYHDCWNSKFGSLSEDRNFTNGLWLCSPLNGMGSTKVKQADFIVFVIHVMYSLANGATNLDIEIMMIMKLWHTNTMICLNDNMAWRLDYLLSSTSILRFLFNFWQLHSRRFTFQKTETLWLGSLEEMDWPAPSCSPSRILQRLTRPLGGSSHLASGWLRELQAIYN